MYAVLGSALESVAVESRSSLRSLTDARTHSLGRTTCARKDTAGMEIRAYAPNAVVGHAGKLMQNRTVRLCSVGKCVNQFFFCIIFIRKLLFSIVRCR